MIKSVSVINYLEERLDLELTGSHESTGIYVRSITGVGPNKANINTVSLASDDGSIFNSAKLEERNIVISLGFYQSTTLRNSIEDSRQKTYKYFPNKKPLTLIFETDNRYLFINGYVESNEPDIFSDEEGTEISIICPDPKFYDVEGGGHIEFGGVENIFEFPYSNESLVENLTEFGRLTHLKSRAITYNGEEENGILIVIHPKQATRNLSLVETETGDSISIDDSKIEQITGNSICPYDTIKISTIKGSKYAELTRSGETYNIINALGRNPKWFQLHKGDNYFTFVAGLNEENVEVYIYYSLAFSGI